MIVTAMLAWFDEPVELLETAVLGCSVIADQLIAADGAYELVPDRSKSSPPEQRRAISKAAKKAGLDLSFLSPRIWSGQVEKRDAILQEAQMGSDWVFPLDADWRITGEREQIRAEMEAAEADSLSVRFFQPVNPQRSTSEIAPHEWHAQNAGGTDRLPLLMRVFDDMRVEKLHWVYSGLKSGHRIGFWGGAHYYVSASVAPLQAPHLFEHRCLFREEKQLERNRVFCELRDRERERTGVEA